MTEQGQVETKEDFGKKPRATVGQWLAEIKAYEKTFEGWLKRADEIQKRYRNEAEASASQPTTKQRKFNLLWSNVETLKPPLYGRVPQADITRKHTDRNPVARASAIILERAVQDQINDHGLDAAMRSGVLDYLLAARGQVWARYVPTYGPETRDRIFLQEDVEGVDEAGAPQSAYRREDNDELVEGEPEFDDDGNAYVEDGEPYRPVVFECVKQEHIPWRDFGHTPAPSWAKVRGAWKREMMTRAQLVERFGKEIGNAVQLTKKATSVSDDDIENYGDVFKRAEVFEVWDKTNRKVIWISEGYKDGPLDEIDDPLKLEDFFPCPPPLCGTVTTDSLVPVPDYDEYRTQADEIDRLTQRIHLLIDALKVVGAYDASFPALEKILTANENRLIAVDQWSIFAEKGGLKGVIDFIPLREIAQTLSALVEAREQLKRDVYELTGLSDIVRGQGNEGAPRTAKEQGIKAQWAGLRLSDRQLAVQRFARDFIKIIAEIAAEHFSADTLWDVSGWEFSDEAIALDQAYQEWEETRTGIMQSFAEWQGRRAAFEDATARMSPEQVQQIDPEKIPPEKPEVTPDDIPEAPPTSKEVFDQAVELLRTDRTRGFAIDIETDSMVLQDQQQEQANRIEFISTITEFLSIARPAMEQYPDLKQAFTQMTMFAVRGFKTGRALETSIEDALENTGSSGDDEEDTQPETDPVALMKAQADMMRLQLDKAEAQSNEQLEQAKMAMKAQKDQMDNMLAQLDIRLKGEELRADAAKTRQEGVVALAKIESDEAIAMQKAQTDIIKSQQRPQT